MDAALASICVLLPMVVVGVAVQIKGVTSLLNHSFRKGIAS